MSNRIRHYMKEEVDALLPLLHDAYRAVGRFQKDRSARNEAKALSMLDEVGKALQAFKAEIQGPKRGYFDAILDGALGTGDRIIALDTAVGAMHIEFAVSRAYMHRESEGLRRALERSRLVEGEIVPAAGAGDNPDVLCHGIPASPGTVEGIAVRVSGDEGYAKLPQGCIAVARMTRPEIICSFGRIAGIVTDIGGSLCHAAIVAREMRIPCVVACGNATERILEGMRVCVCGDDGTVRRVGFFRA